MERPQANVTERYFLTFAHLPQREFVVIRPAADELGAGSCLQIVNARDEVGMNMRLNDVCDAYASRSGQIEINLDVASRIDHSRDPRSDVANDVGKVSQPFGVDGLE
jgi:hypothetical protein